MNFWCPSSLLPSLSHEQLGPLPVAVPGDGGGGTPRFHTQNLQLHHKLLLGSKGLGTAELKAGMEGTFGATEAGPGQGQDGVIITALLQGVVDLVPAPECRLA